jgi:O-acetylhomoserine/O-acetylserine sulfhydrylase-like pyridoxal-dependent enzyme
MTNQSNPETQCVHSGGLPDDATGGINSPIYTSTAAEYLDRGSVPYQRYFNTPNQAAVASARYAGSKARRTACCSARAWRRSAPRF